MLGNFENFDKNCCYFTSPEIALMTKRTEPACDLHLLMIEISEYPCNAEE